MAAGLATLAARPPARAALLPSKAVSADALAELTRRGSLGMGVAPSGAIVIAESSAPERSKAFNYWAVC